MRRTPILEKGDVRVVRVESEGEETIPEHAHEVDEIAYVQKGIAKITIEGEEFHVGEGDAILIPKGEKHWAILNNCTLIAFYHP
jgi:quercetin dioxygenase-like cupin family protein